MGQAPHQPLVPGRSEALQGSGLTAEQEKWNMVVQEYNEYRK